MNWRFAVQVARQLGREEGRKYVVLGYRSFNGWDWYPALSGGRPHRDHITFGQKQRKAKQS